MSTDVAVGTTPGAAARQLSEEEMAGVVALVIKLPKVATNDELKALVVEYTQQLLDTKHTHAGMTVEGWESDARHIAEIMAAKRIVGRFCEAGGLGMLYTFGFAEPCKQMWSMAYVKAQRKGTTLHFGFDTADFEAKVALSRQVFQTLLKDRSIELKPKWDASPAAADQNSAAAAEQIEEAKKAALKAASAESAAAAAVARATAGKAQHKRVEEVKDD